MEENNSRTLVEMIIDLSGADWALVIFVAFLIALIFRTFRNKPTI